MVEGLEDDALLLLVCGEEASVGVREEGSEAAAPAGMWGRGAWRYRRRPWEEG
jgi:hypothetical protein